MGLLSNGMNICRMYFSLWLLVSNTGDRYCKKSYKYFFLGDCTYNCLHILLCLCIIIPPEYLRTLHQQSQWEETTIQWVTNSCNLRILLLHINICLLVYIYNTFICNSFGETSAMNVCHECVYRVGKNMTHIHGGSFSERIAYKCVIYVYK